MSKRFIGKACSGWRGVTLFWALLFFASLVFDVATLAAQNRAIITSTTVQGSPNLIRQNRLKQIPLNTGIKGAPAVPKGINGYTVSVQQEWVGGCFGFTPVRVTVQTNPAKATVEDEWFRIQSICTQYGSGELTTSTELVIPAGQKSGTAEIYVPERFSINAYKNDILVSKIGGKVLLRDSGLSQNTWTSHPKVLAISDEFPAKSETVSICYSGKSELAAVSRHQFRGKSPLPSFGSLQSIYQYAALSPNVQKNFKPPKPNQAASWAALQTGTGMHYSRVADLPYSWIGLAGVDLTMISLDQLKSLSRSSELQRRNLEKWIVSGGVLIVYNTGPEFKQAKQIWPLLLGADRDYIAQSNDVSWRVPSSKVATLTGLIDPNHGGMTNGYSDGATWMLPDENLAKIIDVSKWKQYGSPDEFPKSTPLGVCDYLDGKIVAVDSDMSKWGLDDWKLLHNSIVANGRLITQRVARNAVGEHQYNHNFQIPGVGEPPVKSFQILIGLFLLVAGPIMIIVLKRSRQMQYLFVAVPALSALVCSSLFLYAIIVDGSNRWGRCHSVTHLDHQTSMAVTHARATYYCGKHPGKYELPIDAFGIAHQGGSNSSRIEFDNGLMKLSEGNITARMPHEVTSTRPHATNNRLLVIPSNTEPAETDETKPESENEKQDEKQSGEVKSESSRSIAAPSVQNRLGADVRWALVRTEDGYFSVRNLEEGQTAATKPTTPASELPAIKSIVGELSPQFVGTSYRQAARYYGDYTVNDFGDDQRIVSLLRSGLLEGLLDRPNSYIALLEEFPLAAEQLEPVQYKMQLHVVRGQW